MEDVNKRRRNFLSRFLNSSVVTKKSTAGKFAYIRHFQRIGINATKFEKTLIHFKSDVFATVAVVDAKTPYFFLGEGAAVHRLGQNTRVIRLRVIKGQTIAFYSRYAIHSFLVEIETKAGYVCAKHS